MGLALIALFAFGVTAAASASAHEFVATPVGGTLEDHSTTNQVFKVNAGETVCEKATSTGKITSEKAEKQLVKVTYSGCKAFGQPVKITEAEYEFNANGSVAVKNTITITVEGLGFGCTVKVGPTKNEKLEKITYKNSGTKKLITETNVSGITYTTSGGFCSTGGSNGTYTGSAESEVNKGAGSAQWK
ncbi:MAG: hypothetical protein ACYDHN_12020 [Solirubrobacteraceae bacterium]